MIEFIQKAQEIFKMSFTTEQETMFQIYEDTLVEWNAKINLTAIRNITDIRNKHFLDSLACLSVWSGNDAYPKSIVDVGSGAGFPGIVLAISLPHSQITLVESIGKKAEFCQLVINKLNLKNITVIQERVEIIGHSSSHREKYDCSVARAVASLPVLCEYLLPLVKIHGQMIAMKGNNGQHEIDQASNVVPALGGKFIRSIPYVLPGESDPRMIIVIEKIKSTPHQYPRATGIPTKNPLT